MTSTEGQNGYLNRLCVFYDHSWEQVALNIKGTYVFWSQVNLSRKILVFLKKGRPKRRSYMDIWLYMKSCGEPVCGFCCTQAIHNSYKTTKKQNWKYYCEYHFIVSIDQDMLNTIGTVIV